MKAAALCAATALVLLTCWSLAQAQASASAQTSSAPAATQAALPGGGRITLSKETTYLTSPLNPDGTVNYFAAINERLSKGVTADNNAAMLIVEALGPEAMFNEPVRAEAMALLGIKPTKGARHFVGLWDFVVSLPEADRPAVPDAETQPDLKELDALRKELDAKLAKGEWDGELVVRLEAMEDVRTPADIAEEQLDEALKRPWTAAEFPVLAKWLQANDRPLALTVEASKRPRYYLPLLSASDPPQMIDVLLPNLGSHRAVAKAMTARAMLRLGQGDVSGSQADLLATFRLGRLIGSGFTLIERLVGIAIQALACEATWAMAAGGKLSPDEAGAMLAGLNEVPPFGPMADIVDEGERLFGLDCLMMLARSKDPLEMMGNLDSMSRSEGPATPGRAGLGIGLSMDWDLMLREMNRWYDKLAAGMRLPAQQRREAAAAYEKELTAVKAGIDPFTVHGSLLKGMFTAWGRQRRQRVSKQLAELLISILMPSLFKAADLQDAAEVRMDLSRVALALAAFKAKEGKYPDALSLLSPAYLKKIPSDPFSGKELIYKPTAEGFLLYSVGRNMKDDGGQVLRDVHEGDIVVGTPPPAAGPK